ncbi:MAG: hypothetical protein ACRDO2_10910 [Nocardioidaceae bacterium]
MSPFDLAFIVGPLGAPVIGLLSIVALVVVRPAHWAMWLGTTFSGVTAVAWLTYWLMWGKAFDRADAGLDPRANVEVALNTAIWASAAGCVALAVTVISAGWSARRLRMAGA